MANEKTEEKKDERAVKISEMNIYKKMLYISNELKVVAKNLSVNNQYKAVGEADVIAAVKAGEVKYGVYSYPFSREIVDHCDILGIAYDKDGEKHDKIVSRYMRIKTVYRFVNIDNPAEYIDMTTFADGIDASDKGPGKAETYCDKYALMKAYKMITGDDPDQWAPVSTDDNFIAPSSTKPVKKFEISPETAKQMEELQIDVERLASYYKKKVSELTEKDCLDAIVTKKSSIAKHNAAVEKKEK